MAMQESKAITLIHILMAVIVICLLIGGYIFIHMAEKQTAAVNNISTPRNITDPKYLSTINGVEDIDQFDLPINYGGIDGKVHITYFEYTEKGFSGKRFNCFVTTAGGISCIPEYQSVI